MSNQKKSGKLKKVGYIALAIVIAVVIIGLNVWSYIKDSGFTERRTVAIKTEHFSVSQAQMSYYFYSYVHPDKPYPRNFPGEAVERILADRELYALHFEEILRLSKESKAIFREIAKDVRCNVKMAERYVYEFDNFICLVEDYKALLAIWDLMSGEERSAEISAQVITLAQQRKQARIEHMLLLDQVKEEYLMASHMRNQTIFMQMFADIAAYASKTAPEALDLNLLDMRAIGSNTFFGLR